MSLKYTVFGTGALGGYYGSMLQRSGLSVDFLARSDYQHIKDRGLKIDSIMGDFEIPRVQVYPSSDQLPETDVVLITMKTTSNGSLPELLRPIVKKGTHLMVMQNGLGMEAELKQAFPEAEIIGAMCFICSQKRGPGYIVHMDKGSINAAPLEPSKSTMIRQIAQDFNNAGIEMTLSDHLNQARWNKLLWNIPFNGLSVVLNGNTQEMMAHPQGEWLARKLMEEVVQASEACGAPVNPEQIEKMLYFTKIMTPYDPSMKLDFDNGRAMEVKYMYWNPLNEAKKQGLELPFLEMLTRQLDFINDSLEK